MAESDRIAITDGNGNNKLASVVVSTDDPTKNALVVLNAD
jgi:hypothetical protein